MTTSIAEDELRQPQSSRLLHEELTGTIIAAAVEVHRELGPGLLESAYQTCLAHEVSLRGVKFETEVGLPVDYKEIRLDCGYRMDLVVERKVVIEIKSVDRLLPVHQAQLLTYLRLSGLRVGLLINFNVRVLRDGIVRRIL